MTTLKTKSSEKKRNSYTHTLSQSETGSEGDTDALSNKTPVRLISNTQPSKQRKKPRDIPSNLNDSCMIFDDTTLFDETATPSRQSKKFGGITSSLNESCIAGKTIIFDETAFHRNASPTVRLTGNQRSPQAKKFGGITSSLNESRIAGNTIIPDETMRPTAGLAANQQPNRKRKRIEHIESCQNDSFLMSEETVLLDDTPPAGKPSKPKKRKINDARVADTSVPSMSQEPVAGPSRASDPPEPPGVSDVSYDTPILLDEDAENQGYLLHIDPTEASLLYEHLTEDEEIWMIQCPKFINPELLVGNRIDLRKKSMIKCRKEDGSDLKLDSYPVTTEEGTSKINLILPSEDEFLKIKVTDLRGKLILTEQVTVPEIDYATVMNARKEEVAFPSNLKVRHPLLGLDIPKGRTLSAKERRKDAKKLNRTSRTSLTEVTEDEMIMSQDLFADCEEDRQASRNIASTKKNKNPSNPGSTSCSRNIVEMSPVGIDAYNCLDYQTPAKSKKKKHAESHENDQEIKTELPLSDPVSADFYPEDSSIFAESSFRAQANFTSNDRSHLGDLSMSQPLNTVNSEGNSVSKSKKKKKKRAETSVTVDANDLSMEFKDEPRDPLETSECTIDGAVVTFKKKKKKHRERVSNDVETANPEFKEEPVDPLDIGLDYSVDNFTSPRSKKKKKRHSEAVINDSEILDGELKVEPRDPLDVGAEFSHDDSYSIGEKKRKKHEGIRLNDSTVLPVVCKNEWDDSQYSSFNQDDNLSNKSKKKKKKRQETMNYENLVEELPYRNPATDFNPSQNNELISKHKKKKKHSLATSDIHEISLADEESFNQFADQSLNSSSGKSKKKKRKSGLDNNTDELTDASFIKVEAPESGENEIESNFSIFNPDLSHSLPSFLDTLSSNYEFSSPNSPKSKKKKKKSRQTVE